MTHFVNVRCTLRKKGDQVFAHPDFDASHKATALVEGQYDDGFEVPLAPRTKATQVYPEGVDRLRADVPGYPNVVFPKHVLVPDVGQMFQAGIIPDPNARDD